MLENQAFGWLRQAIGGGANGGSGGGIFGGGNNSNSGNGGGDPKIVACSDPSELVDGISADFERAAAARRRER